MATLQEIADQGTDVGLVSPAAVDLSDLSFFNNRSIGGVDEAEMNSPRAQAMLANLRKLDPNAQFVATQLGGEGASGQVGYTLNFDASKLPGLDGSGQLGGKSGVGTGNTFITPWSTVQDKMTLALPGAVAESPIYGKVTSNRNITQPAGWLDYAGPAAVMLFGTIMSGGALTPLMQAMLKTPQALANIDRGGNPLASVLSLAGSATGIPGASAVGSYAGNAISNQNRGD